jgi:formate-dependent phosphoribosylglycinamide formyltransferase (GAR transformylase)
VKISKETILKPNYIVATIAAIAATVVMCLDKEGWGWLIFIAAIAIWQSSDNDE